MTDLLTHQDTDTIGGRIGRSRALLDLTTAQLAAKLGVRAETMRGWERDRSEPRANRLIMLAGILGVSPAWLIGGYGDGPQEDGSQNAEAASRLDELKAQRAVLDGEIARLEAATAAQS